MRAIRSGLRLGWLTTSAGFAFLLLAPFDSLRQVAVFGVAGLSGAYLSVVLLLPQLPERLLSHAPTKVLQALSSRWPAADKPSRAFLLLIVASIGGSLVLAKNLHSSENVRALHAGSQGLLDQEKHARGLVDSIDAAQLFILHGTTDEQLLRTSQALDSALQQAVARGQLKRFMSISQALPHLAEQQRIHAHWAKTIFTAGAALDQLQAQLPLPAPWLATQRQRFAASQPLTLSDWQSSAASWPQRDLLIDTLDGEQWAMVRLGGIAQLSALHGIAEQLQSSGHDVQFFDPLDAASQGLSSARQAATKVLGLALLAVLLILVLRYGVVAGLISCLPLALAISVCLAGLALRDQHFSLFCVFALLLVVGMAIDYGLFVREGPRNDVHSLLAVSLSAMTTLLAFGLLGFSSTPALKDFGFIVTLGIASAWLSTLLLHRAGWMDKA